MFLYSAAIFPFQPLVYCFRRERSEHIPVTPSTPFVGNTVLSTMGCLNGYALLQNGPISVANVLFSSLSVTCL